MDTKPLLYGLIGFFIGGLLVSIAATTFEAPEKDAMNNTAVEMKNLRGDDFDEAYIAAMIEHHQGAIDMAELAETRAQHQEIRELSKAIISAQESEIKDMRSWQKAWGYATEDRQDSGGMSH